jgi:hypothetical protein
MFNYISMLYWFIKCIIFLLLIGLLHHLYSFLIDTLTVPKLRDFVNNPTERYNDIVMTSSNNEASHQPSISRNEMQNELRDFLSNIKKEPDKEFYN